jgi:hypothetical protein
VCPRRLSGGAFIRFRHKDGARNAVSTAHGFSLAGTHKGSCQVKNAPGYRFFLKKSVSFSFSLAEHNAQNVLLRSCLPSLAPSVSPSRLTVSSLDCAGFVLRSFTHPVRVCPRRLSGGAFIRFRHKDGARNAVSTAHGFSLAGMRPAYHTL